MTEPTADDTKPRPKPGFEFIPKLKDKTVMIRMGSGGQPITGTLEAYNPYEILIKTPRAYLLVFKHAIATIEVVEEPGGYRISDRMNRLGEDYYLDLDKGYRVFTS